MNEDDLVIEIDDETLEALTRMAKLAGVTVEEMAKWLIEADVRGEPVSPEAS
jgi:hypothetical protein